MFRIKMPDIKKCVEAKRNGLHAFLSLINQLNSVSYISREFLSFTSPAPARALPDDFAVILRVGRALGGEQQDARIFADFELFAQRR